MATSEAPEGAPGTAYRVDAPDPDGAVSEKAWEDDGPSTPQRKGELERVSLERTQSGKVFSDGPLSDPVHIPGLRYRGMPLMPLAPAQATYDEDWQKSWLRRNVTYVQGSMEFQSVIFATVLLEAALVVSSLVAGAHDVFPETDKTYISDGVLYLLCLDFAMRVVGYGAASIRQIRTYFDGAIVALALTLTYLPVSAFDSLEETYDIKAASIAVSLRLGARFLRFALLLRILIKTAVDAAYKKPAAADVEAEEKRLRLEKMQRGKLSTPSVSNASIVAFALGYLWKFERLNTLRMILEIVLNAGCSIAQPFLLSLIFDEFIPAKDYAKCTYGVVGVVGTMLLKAQMNYRIGNDNPSGGDFIPLLTKNLTRKAVRLPWSLFSSMHGDFVVNALGTDMTDANANLDLMVNGFAAVLDLIAVLLTMALFSWQMTVCIALSLPLVVLYNKRKSKQVSHWAEKLNGARKRSEAHVQEIVHHVQHIKLLGIGPVMWSRLLTICDELGEAFDTFDERKYGNIRGLAFLSMFTTLITIAYGTVQVILGQLSMGKLLGFLQLAQGIDVPIQALTVGLLGLTASRPAMAHIIGLLEAPEDHPGREPPRDGALVLSDVMYEYDYENFKQKMGPYTFELESGSSCAIVGASGCGKSTMLKLLAGMFKPTTGDVTVDGVPIDEFDTTRLIAWMEQESILLTGTLRENLVAGSTRAIPETELMRACDLARFDWGKLAEGIDTYLGQNGSNLSAGDRQRVAAARTILLRRPFIVCDEPTSAQDPATAGPVMASLLSAQFDPAPGRPPRRCTTVAVTHSISNAMRFDKVCVVSQGTVVEMGDTKKLLNLNGHFAQMVRNLNGITILPSGVAMISAERLMDLWIFSRVRESKLLVEFTAAFVSKQVRAGEAVASCGQPADAAFIVARGALAVKDREGAIVRTYEEGEMAGGINLHGATTRRWGFTLTALRASVILSISKEALEKELERADPAVRDAAAETQAAMASAIHPTSLRRVWAFATVPSASLPELVSRLEVGFFSEKKRLFMHPKDPPSDAMIVAHGGVSVRYRHAVYGEYAQTVGAHSCFAESSFASKGKEGTPFAGVAPRTNKGQSLTAITTVPTVLVIASRALICAGGEHLEALAARAPRAAPQSAFGESGESGERRSGWKGARSLSKKMSIATASSKKPALDIASAALANMSVFEKRAAEARAELEAHPRVFVSRLVSDVKRLAAADALAEHFLLGALPRDVLEAVAGALAVAPVEEGQVLNGPYGWGSDAVAVVAGAVRATYPGGPGRVARAATHRAGAVVNFEALLNEAAAAFPDEGTETLETLEKLSISARRITQPERVEVVSGGCVVLRLPRRAFLALLERSSRSKDTSETVPVSGTVADDRGVSPALSPRVARALDAARGVARARDALFTAEGCARVAPAETRACSTPEERLALAEALVASAATSRPPPAGSRDAAGIAEKETEKETSPTSPSTVVCLAGAVDVHTLAEEDASDPVAPAEGTRSSEGASAKRRSKSFRKEKPSTDAADPSDARNDARDAPSPEREPRTFRVLSVETFEVNDVFTLRENQRVVAAARAAGDADADASENERAFPFAATCSFPVAAGDGRLTARRSALAARRAADAAAAEERARRQARVRQVKSQTHEAEVALGLRTHRSARSNWRVALKRLRVFRATCDDTQNMVMNDGADSGACDLEEQLDMQSSILAETAASLLPRQERLRSLLERWAHPHPVPLDADMEPARGEPETDPGGPALGPGEGDDGERGGTCADPENGDLSSGRLDAFEDLVFARERARARRLESYGVTLDRLRAEPEIAKIASGASGADDASPAAALDAASHAARLALAESRAAIDERRRKREAAAAIPRHVLDDAPELLKLFGVRIDAKAALARRQETERAERTRAAFAAASRAARAAREVLRASTAAKEAALRGLYDELCVVRGGPEDDLRPDGGSLHASRFGGRVERRNAALAEAVERVEKGAVLTRAAVAREREAAKEALEQMEASIRAETSAELEKARDLIARSKSLGSKAVGFDEKVWSTAPFAREVMRKFRVTLAVKRAFESLADDIVAEVAFEAVPEAARETRREIREAFKDMPDVLELSPDEDESAESDGASESGLSSSLSRSSFGDGDDDDDGSHAGPANLGDADVSDDDTDSDASHTSVSARLGTEPVRPTAADDRRAAPSTPGATAVGARRRVSERGARALLEASLTERRIALSGGDAENEDANELEVSESAESSGIVLETTVRTATVRDADDADASDASTQYSVSDVSDVSTPSVTDSDEDEAGRAF